MELTKPLVKKILKEAVKLDKLDQKEQDLFDKLFSFIAPDSYSPIINTKRSDSFIRGIDMVFPGIGEDIEYYLYEVPSMKSEKIICGIAGKEYDARNIDEYVQFIIDSWK